MNKLIAIFAVFAAALSFNAHADTSEESCADVIQAGIPEAEMVCDALQDPMISDSFEKRVLLTNVGNSSVISGYLVRFIDPTVIMEPRAYQLYEGSEDDNTWAIQLRLKDPRGNSACYIPLLDNGGRIISSWQTHEEFHKIQTVIALHQMVTESLTEVPQYDFSEQAVVCQGVDPVQLDIN